MKNGLKKEDSMALKGLAVMMMVFHHCFYKASKFAKYDVAFRGISANSVMTAASCMKICVALFAFVSGYGLMCGYSRYKSEKNPGTSRWIGAHLVSTLSGYWFIAAGAYVLYAFLTSSGFESWGENVPQRFVAVIIDILGLAELAGTRTLNGSWWYMSAAVLFIIFVPIGYTAIKKWGCAVVLGIIVILPRATGMGFPGGADVFSFFLAFATGMVCAEYNFFSWFHELGSGRKNGRLCKGLLLFGCLAAAFCLYPKLDLKVIWEYHYMAVPFLVIMFCVEYLFKIPWISSLFQHFGKYSLNIWLLHTFIRDYFGKFVFAVREFWLVPVVLLLISLLLAYVVEVLKRVTGYQKLISALMRKLR